VSPASSDADSTVVLPTTVPGIGLRRLTVADAPAYREVVRRNLVHLGRDGDWHDEMVATLAEVEGRFADLPAADHTFGIFELDTLVGQVTLVHATPTKWGLGFWLTEAATGRGVMTASIREVLAHARVVLGATEVLASVSHGNDASSAVLVRLGFVPVARLRASTRYRRTLH